MGTPQLSKAEQDFFTSGGETIADSLKEGLPEAPIAPVKGNNMADVEAPRGTETTTEVKTEAQPIVKTEVKAAETEEQKAQAKAEREKRRKEAVEELGLVPLEALQEARQEGKATKQQLEELRAWRQQVEPILKDLPKAPVPAGEQNPYDKTVQPAEYQAWQDWMEVKTGYKTLKDKADRQDQITQSQAQTQQLLGWNQAQENAYKAQNPAYDDAFKFAEKARQDELKAIAPWLDENAIAAEAQRDRANLILLAAQRTMAGFPTNPAELVFNYAKSKGFTGKPAAPAEDRTAVALEKIAAGQQAAGGLNGGSTGKAKMTMEDVARMPTKTPEQKAAFQKAWNEVVAGR